MIWRPARAAAARHRTQQNTLARLPWHIRKHEGLGMKPVVRRAIGAALALAAALLALVLPARADRGVVETIRTRGHLVCGVGEGPKGYSHTNPQGAWSGIGVDFCRALAAAVL